MDMESFFQKILPAGGFKIIAAQVPGKPGLSHKVCQSAEEAAAVAAAIDARAITVYHACNSFGDWYEEGGKRRIRTQSNVTACRSIYDDMDVAAETEGKYGSRNEAAQHLRGFLTASNVPAPLIVASGRGLHLYWPVDRDITPQEWMRLSMAKRRATKHFGLKVDRTVDLDPARVLRPVGTHWRKEDPPRAVTLVHDAGPFDYDALLAAFETYAEQAGAPELTAPRSASQLDEMRVEVEYPPASLAVAAQFCAQLATFRDTGCADSEPQWYNCIGVAKHCFDGETLAHEWSAQDPRYDRFQTQSKLDQWGFGPATCAQFREKFPEGCEGCTMQVKSPVQLGYVEQAPEAPAAAASHSIGSSDDAQYNPLGWPPNVHYMNGKMHMASSDENGVVNYIPFAHPKFWPVERVVLEDGTAALRMQAEIKPGKIREFDLPYKNIVDPRSLRVALGAYEVVVMNDKLAAIYTHDYSSWLRTYYEETNTYTQFGWHGDGAGFLIGNKLITENGVNTVRISERAIKEPALHNTYQVRGSAEEWAAGVNELYNRENGEPYQYVISSVFGSVLVPILNFDDWNGIPLAITSDQSALGKSTVCHIAINALYRSTNSFITNSTTNAILARASTMKNLTVLFDEVTHYLKDAKDLGPVLYALSNGKGRVGLNSDGTERQPYPPWKLNSYLTGNRNLIFQLTESKQNPEAQMMRVLEIDLSAYPPMETFAEGNTLSERHRELALHLMNNVYGVLAEPYISYVIKHRHELQEKLRDVFFKISKQLGGRGTKERFYAYHIACTLVGAAIARKMGYLQFDLNLLKTWILAHVRRLRSDADEHNMTPPERFSAMLADLHGRILITKHYDSLNSRANKTEMPLVPLRDAVAARLVLGDETERGKLFVAVRAIDDWCKTYGVNPAQYKRELFAAGLIRSVAQEGRKDRLIVLGKGVPTHPTGDMRCLEFSYAAAQGYIDEFVGEGKVVPLQGREAAEDNTQKGATQ